MEIFEINNSAISMAGKVNEIIELTEKGFMENKAEFLTRAMAKEGDINDTEKLLTKNILELSKMSKNRRNF